MGSYLGPMQHWDGGFEQQRPWSLEESARNYLEEGQRDAQDKNHLSQIAFSQFKTLIREYVIAVTLEVNTFK